MFAGNYTQAHIWWGSSSGGYNIYEALWFGTNDVGHTFTISSPVDDEDFFAAVRSLTDGTNNQIDILEGTGPFLGGWTFWESDLFQNVPRTGPDLTGFQITSFDLTINAFEVSYHSGVGMTEINGMATLSIEGTQIPEPKISALTSVTLVAYGLFGLVRRKCS